MQTPVISIIVPIYNAEKFLNRTLNSVLTQDYKDYELILVDDGSTDNSLAICKAFKQQNQCTTIIVEQNEKNMGLSVTRNTGLNLAHGELITFLDADDWIEPDFLSAFNKLMNNNADLAVSSYYSDGFMLSLNLTGKIHVKQVDRKVAAAETTAPVGRFRGFVWNKCYRKSIIDQYKIQFDPKLVAIEDQTFNLQYIKYCKKILVTNKRTYHYVTRMNSLVHTKSLQKYEHQLKLMFLGKKLAQSDDWEELI